MFAFSLLHTQEAIRALGIANYTIQRIRQKTKLCRLAGETSSKQSTSISLFLSKKAGQTPFRQDQEEPHWEQLQSIDSEKFASPIKSQASNNPNSARHEILIPHFLFPILSSLSRLIQQIEQEHTQANTTNSKLLWPITKTHDRSSKTSVRHPQKFIPWVHFSCEHSQTSNETKPTSMTNSTRSVHMKLHWSKT